MPRFSLRVALVLLSCGSVLSLVLAAAWRGEYWAQGMVAAALAALAMLVVQALVYCVARLVGFVTPTAPNTPALAPKVQRIVSSEGLASDKAEGQS